MTYDAFLELVQKRRSVRSFKPDPLPDDYVERIIEAARFAPSGANSQPWEFVVIKDREMKDRIAALVAEQGEPARKVEVARDQDMQFPGAQGPAREPGYKGAPVFILLCGDPRTKEAYPLFTTMTRGDSHFASSLAGAFLYMTLAATLLGLGSQWVSATGGPLVKPLLRKLLEIPYGLEIYDMLVVGWPASQPNARFVRDHAEMVHYERFDKVKYRSDAQMREYIARLRKG